MLLSPPLEMSSRQQQPLQPQTYQPQPCQPQPRQPQRCQPQRCPPQPRQPQRRQPLRCPPQITCLRQPMSALRHQIATSVPLNHHLPQVPHHHQRPPFILSHQLPLVPLCQPAIPPQPHHHQRPPFILSHQLPLVSLCQPVIPPQPRVGPSLRLISTRATGSWQRPCTLALLLRLACRPSAYCCPSGGAWRRRSGRHAAGAYRR